MSQAIVGRIFWKEARVQRAFWVWIFGLGIFIQLLPTLLGRSYYRSAIEYHWFYSVNVVVGCCFAAGSAAIAFAGETEGRTKSLFQRLPLRTADLLMGKLGWSLAGTYALVVILALTATLWGGAWAGAVANNAKSPSALDSHVGDFWMSAVTPLPFLIVGVLCSLAFREVLTAVAVAGVATAVLMGFVAAESWIAAALVLAVAAVADVLLVPHWVTDSFGSPLAIRLRRFAPARAELGHSTLSVRSSVAWRRVAGSLLWKEWRQAAPLTFTLAGAGTLLIFLFGLGGWLEYRAERVSRIEWAWFRQWQVFLTVALTAVPLMLGIGAGRADRRDGTYRLLANRGVSPNAYWLSKHIVWLGLAILTVLWFLGWERLTAGFEMPGMPGEHVTLWSWANGAARETFFGFSEFGDPSPAEVAAAALAVLAFAVVLLYALGHLLSLMIPSALSSLVLGMIAWGAIVLAWAAVVEYEVPCWWTVGLVPVFFLFAGWLRTHYWLIERNSLAAWGRVAASLVAPIIAVWCGVAVFRVVQIPPTTLPLELRGPAPQTLESRASKQSLFVDALKALTDRPRSENLDESSLSNQWGHLDAETRAWVEANEPARKLALEAAQRPPGDFQELAEIRRQEQRGIVVEEGLLRNRVFALESLLSDSARKLEFGVPQLEKALDTYVAAARFGDDLERSQRAPYFLGTAIRMSTLSAMDRWAINPMQTPELIKRAISVFQRFDQEAPLLSPRILGDWRLERDYFEDFVWKGNNPSWEMRTVSEMGIVRWFLPWELLRLQRVQDAMFFRALDEMQLAERELHDRGFVDAELITTAGRRQPPWKWAWTTLEPPTVSPNGGSWVTTAMWRVNRAALSDLHLLAWAAADYRREHKQLPGALSELVPTYFASLPVDPWTGRDFLYEPKGVPARLHSQLGGDLDPNQPFIASGGELGCHIEIDRERRGGTAPLRIISRRGGGISTLQVPVEFPAPTVAIPSLTGPHKSPDTPPAEPTAKPAGKPLAEPATKPPGGNAPPRK